MIVKLYDKVILKDGHHGVVVEILEPGVVWGSIFN